MPTPPAAPLEDLERELRSWREPLRESPALRYASRRRFYARYGLRPGGPFSRGNSELAFMHWTTHRPSLQISR